MKFLSRMDIDTCVEYCKFFYSQKKSQGKSQEEMRQKENKFFNLLLDTFRAYNQRNF